MFWCCCVRLHRHQLHLASYGCVSFSLILAGIIFTVFAVFQKDSQIGKIWLAGPVLIVVGGVLCGKVMIDWGPAMERGRRGSIDSRLVDEYGYSNLITAGGGGAGMVGSPEIAQHHLKIPVNNRPSISSGFIASSLAQIGNVSPSLPNPSGHLGFDCITYSSEVPASPLKCPPEMVDKTTQAKEGCEKSPKVIGRFVFSELNGGPSQHQPNYGTLAREEEKAMLPAATHHLPAQNHLISSSNNNQGGGGRRKFYSQGETLIMNERSFLI